MCQRGRGNTPCPPSRKHCRPIVHPRRHPPASPASSPRIDPIRDLYLHHLLYDRSDLLHRPILLRCRVRPRPRTIATRVRCTLAINVGQRFFGTKMALVLARLRRFARIAAPHYFPCDTNIRFGDARTIVDYSFSYQ